MICPNTGLTCPRNPCLGSDNPDICQHWKSLLDNRAASDARYHVDDPCLDSRPFVRRERPKGLAKELVVAKFREDCTWVNTAPMPVVIYDKCPATSEKYSSHVIVRHLQNVGRENYSYLTHIVENYHDLAQWTYFTQANFHNGSKEDLFARLNLNYTDTTPLNTYYQLDFPPRSVKDKDRVDHVDDVEARWGDAKYHGARSLGRNKDWLTKTWQYYFASPQPETIWFGYSAAYAVPQHRIKGRSKGYWEWLLGVVRDHPNASEQSPESAYAFETMWYYLWGDASIYRGRNAHKPMRTLPKTGCRGCRSKILLDPVLERQKREMLHQILIKGK